MCFVDDSIGEKRGTQQGDGVPGLEGSRRAYFGLWHAMTWRVRRSMKVEYLAYEWETEDVITNNLEGAHVQ